MLRPPRAVFFADQQYPGEHLGVLIEAPHTSDPNELACRRRVAATTKATHNLCCTLTFGPKLFEQRCVFCIPAHETYYNAERQVRASPLFVWVARSRSFSAGPLLALLM